MTMVDDLLARQERGLPIPLMECPVCHGTIWKHRQWRQCPDCGALTTEFGGIFTHASPVPDFVAAVNEVREQLARS